MLIPGHVATSSFDYLKLIYVAPTYNKNTVMKLNM